MSGVREVLMEWWYFLLGGILLAILFGFAFRRYLSALVMDYAIDMGLSFADEAFGGFLGLDIGDLVAAIIIFVHEKRISGTAIAVIVAWEALNFLPLGLIPGIGTGLEWVLNVFPAVTLSRLIFGPYRKERRLRKKITLTLEQLKSANIIIPKKLQQEIDDADETSPVESIRQQKEILSKLADLVTKDVHQLLNNAEDILEQLADLDEQLPIDEPTAESLALAIENINGHKDAAKKALVTNEPGIALEQAKKADAVASRISEFIGQMHR